jgi:hypothetical protein
MPIDDADIIRSTVYRVMVISGATIDAGDWADHTNRIEALEDLSKGAPGTIVANGKYGPMSTLSGAEEAGKYNRYMTVNRLYAAPFFCPVDATFDQLGLQVAVAGAAGATVRMGIYAASDIDRLPSTLLLDAGTVDASVTGFRFAPISQVLGRGTYWLAGASNDDTVQVLANQSPGLTAFAGHLYTDGTGPLTILNRVTDLDAGFTALPATFGSMAANIGAPYFWLRGAVT